MVKDNPARQRFELEHDGQVAFSAYRRAPGTITITHTEVPDAFRGQGVGSKLARGVLELIAQGNDKLVARCPFIAGYIEKHPEFRPLLER